MSRTYVVGLPVVITVEDDGTVVVEPDLSEAGNHDVLFDGAGEFVNELPDWEDAVHQDSSIIEEAVRAGIHKQVPVERHTFDGDADRCTCGAEWVYHEDTPVYGHSCERSLPCAECHGAHSSRHTVDCWLRSPGHRP